jgi:hypothetical protein
MVELLWYSLEFLWVAPSIGGAPGERRAWMLARTARFRPLLSRLTCPVYGDWPVNAMMLVTDDQ